MYQQSRNLSEPKNDVNLLPESQFQEYIGPKDQDVPQEDQNNAQSTDLINRVNSNLCNDWSTVLPSNAKIDQNLHNIHPVSGFVYKHEAVPEGNGLKPEVQSERQNLTSAKSDKFNQILDEKGDYLLPSVLPNYNEQWSKDEPTVLHNMPGVDNFDNYDPKNWDMRPDLKNEETPNSNSDISNNTELIKDLLDTNDKPTEPNNENLAPVNPLENPREKTLMDITVEGIVNAAKNLLVSTTSLIDRAVEKVSDTFADLIIEDPFALPGDLPEKHFSDMVKEELFPPHDDNLKAEFIIPENVNFTVGAGQHGVENKLDTVTDQMAITDNATEMTQEYRDVVDELESHHHPRINPDEIKLAETK